MYAFVFEGSVHVCLCNEIHCAFLVQKQKQKDGRYNMNVGDMLMTFCDISTFDNRHKRQSKTL